MAISCENGFLYEWNFVEKPCILKILRVFEWDKESIPTCIDYSPDGNFLSAATKNGRIFIYEVEKGEWQPSVLDVSEQEKARAKVNMQIFSSDSKQLATMDDDFSVTLFTIGTLFLNNNADHKLFDPKNPKEWQYVGKHRVHHAPIKSIAFAESLNEAGQRIYKIYSVSEDKMLAEFDVVEIDYNKIDKGTVNYIDRLKLRAIYPVRLFYNSNFSD